MQDAPYGPETCPPRANLWSRSPMDGASRSSTPSPQPFLEFERQLLALYQPPLRSRSTLETMARVLRELRGIERPPETTAGLTTEAVVSYVATRSKAVCTNTVVGELGYLRAACTFAVEEGWLDRNPFSSRRLRVRPEPPSGRKYHTLAEVSRVLVLLRDRSESWAGGRLHAAASVVAYTGLRRNEALFLRCEDVDLDAGLLFVVPRGRNRLKTVASAAPVPVAPELAEVLAGWLPRCDSEWLIPTRDKGRPWTGGNPGTKPLDRLKQAGAAAGVERFTWQSLRHSWATHAETAWGLPEGAIRRVLRHTTDLTQRSYRHADAANLVALARSVSYAASDSSSG